MPAEDLMGGGYVVVRPRGEDRADDVRASEAALLKYALLLTGNRADAEELVQDSWLKYLDHRHTNSAPQIRDEAAYLRKIITTTFISSRRRATVWHRRLPLLVGRGLDPDSQDRTAMRDQLARALSGLPARQRSAVLMRYYHDLRFSEIAAELGCSEATSRNLVSRALKRLRVEIENGHLSCE